jgi:hypothetical protein
MDGPDPPDLKGQNGKTQRAAGRESRAAQKQRHNVAPAGKNKELGTKNDATGQTPIIGGRA